jgi:hypothetical protein
MNDVASMIINNGAAIGLLVYFVYKDNKFTSMISKSLTNISNSLDIIQDILNKEVKKNE